MGAPKKVCIVGSGNWGSAIARLVGYNAARLPDRFQKEVAMWVFEEEVNGRKLTEIINTEHENVKYLPGRALPENVVAIPDISVAAQDADFLIFVLPHQFIGSKDAEAGADLKLLFQTENFRVSVVSDTQIVEICGALKNIVACAAGFCDGLKCGDNTKAATIRLGLKEMMKYGEHFYPGGNPATYFESCGVADLIT